MTAGASRPGRRILVLGGARSGKSKTAERIVSGYPRVDYAATGPAPDPEVDPEWARRVERHRGRRPDGWRTWEIGEAGASAGRGDGRRDRRGDGRGHTVDLVALLGAETPVPLLIDCLSTWLSTAMDGCGVWEARPGADESLAARVDALVAAWETSARRLAIAVSGEVGCGVVPATAAGRRFRDELGELNTRVAEVSDEVWLCTAGIARRLR